MAHIPDPSPQEPDSNSPTRLKEIISARLNNLPPSVTTQLESSYLNGQALEVHEPLSELAFVDALLSGSIAQARSEVVESAFVSGSLHQLFCEALTYEALYGLACEAFAGAVRQTSFFQSEYRALAVYDVPSGRSSLTGEGKKLPPHIPKQCILMSSTTVGTVPEDFCAQDAFELLGNTLKGSVIAVREVTLFSDPALLQHLFGSELQETLPNYQVLVTPVRYGDSLLALAITLAFSPWSNDKTPALDGSFLNRCIVVGDALARAIAHLERVRRSSKEVH